MNDVLVSCELFCPIDYQWGTELLQYAMAVCPDFTFFAFSKLEKYSN